MKAHVIDLARSVGRLLQQHQKVLVTAESCTGGGIAQAMTAIAGSSGWFEGGFVTYSNALKQSALGVGQATLANHGAVSEAVAIEMAEGALKHSTANVSVAVTGIAGPDGGTEDKPVGTVWLAWASRAQSTKTLKYQFDGDRFAIRDQAVTAALNGLLGYLDKNN